MKQVCSFLGLVTSNTNIIQAEEPKQTYVDPGYNDDPMKTFLQKNENKGSKKESKKIMTGPGQKKNPFLAKK